MKNKTKKITAASTVVAGIIAVASGALINSTEPIQYSVENINDYIAKIEIIPPEKESIDLIEMYVNDQFVTQTILPNGQPMTTIPLIFNELSTIEFKLYNKGKVEGIASFDENDELQYQDFVIGEEGY